MMWRFRRLGIGAGVLLALCLVVVGPGVAGATLRWPSSPIWMTPTPAPTPAASATLDEETLQRLTIFAFWPGEEPVMIPVDSLGETLQALPGGSLALTLGVYECCYFFQPVAARAIWSVAPAAGVRIDSQTGLLSVDPGTPSGSVFTVHADVEDGRRIVSAELHIFTPDANPLVGTWQETAQIDCATGDEVVPALPIEELIFGADGTFSVTWLPFEVYKDYWGTYTFDLAAGTLDLVVEGGNFIPPDVDGHGTFALDTAGQLILTNLWLGTPQVETGTANCGHHFAP